MGFSDSESREASIQKHLSYLREQYRILDAVCDEAKNTEVSENGRDIFTFQLLSACYGRELYKFNIDWFESVLAKMKDGKI